MASRSSTSLATAGTITTLSILLLAAVVAFFVFFGKFRQAQRDLNTERATSAEFVKADERNRDDVRALKEQAKGKSLVGYLTESYGEVMARTTGSKRESMTGFKDKLASIPGAEASPLLQVIRDRDAQINQLKDAVAKAEADRQRANQDLQAEVERVKGIEDRTSAATAALNADVGKYKSEVETYREGVNKTKEQMDARVDTLRKELADTQKSGDDRIGKLQEENLVLQNQLSVLRGDKKIATFKAGDEYALVDGNIVAVDGAARQAIISIGAAQHVPLGITFSVYSDASALRPDEDGNYPRGKAGLEVINVGPSSATCRIVWESRGNPVVTGDAIANPVYDPAKTYKFLVFGNFDINSDGVATAAERDELAALITSWGGKVVDDLGGDVDFLVLGERPVLPPKPSPDTPIEVMQEFIRQDRVVQRYDRLYQQAQTTSLPILNENRLFTLLGQQRNPRQ